MSLAAVAARRMLLRRGAGALAALFVTSGSGNARAASLAQSAAPSPGHAYPATGPDDGQQARQTASRKFYDEQNRIVQKQWTRHRAWFEQDPDLVILQSTSPAWRASVMYDRLRARQNILDRLENQLRQIWEAPLDKLRDLVAGWIGGAA